MKIVLVYKYMQERVGAKDPWRRRVPPLPQKRGASGIPPGNLCDLVHHQTVILGTDPLALSPTVGDNI